MARKVRAEELAEWQKDHWRAVALCDLIMTANSESEENERLVELRKIKAKWGYTLITGYDPNIVRTSQPKQKGLSSHPRGAPEAYVSTSGSVGASRAAKATRRVHGASHAK